MPSGFASILLSAVATALAGASAVWRVVIVLFTNASAANTHVTTEDQLFAAIDAGDASTVDTPIVFDFNLVSAATYARATPLQPASP